MLEEKGGFISAHWDGTAETEERIKQETKATIRCIPLDAKEEAGSCIYTGKPSARRVLFAISILSKRLAMDLPMDATLLLDDA